MRWIRSKLVVYVSLFLVSLCFGSFIVNQKNNVNAIEPVYTSTNVSNLGYACTGVAECKNLSYLTASCDDSSSDFYIIFWLSSNIRYYPSFSDYFILPSSYNTIQVSYSNSSALCTFNLYNQNPIVSIPTGSLSITENGEYDVSSYATVVVEVPDTETIIQGDYHDDLVNIYNAIIICAGVALVIYFFYCIYRMIIKTTGGY